MSKYLVINKIIDEEQLIELDKEIEDIGWSDNLKKIKDYLIRAFKEDDRLSQDEIEELIKYAIYTRSSSDIQFVKEHLDEPNSLCIGCGWCCSEKENIYLAKWELDVLPDNLKNFIQKEKDSNYYKIQYTKPCCFLSSNNKCTIYKHRPSGCKGYPLTLNAEKVVVISPDFNCGFVRAFFEIKVEMFIQRVLNAKKSDKDVKELDDSYV